MTTKVKALDRLIDAIAGSDVPVSAQTVAGTIDALADTLAGDDVSFTAQDIAGRIDELAGMVEDGTITIGGGGGGVTLGNCAKVAWASTLPQSIQDIQTIEWDNFGAINTYIGDSVVSMGYYDASQSTYPCAFASGAQVHAKADNIYSDTASVSAVIFYAELSDDTPVLHFDEYTGVTYDSETGMYVIPLHDIPAPMVSQGKADYPTIFCKNDAR